MISSQQHLPLGKPVTQQESFAAINVEIHFPEPIDVCPKSAEIVIFKTTFWNHLLLILVKDRCAFHVVSNNLSGKRSAPTHLAGLRATLI